MISFKGESESEQTFYIHSSEDENLGLKYWDTISYKLQSSASAQVWGRGFSCVKYIL